MNYTKCCAIWVSGFGLYWDPQPTAMVLSLHTVYEAVGAPSLQIDSPTAYCVGLDPSGHDCGGNLPFSDIATVYHSLHMRLKLCWWVKFVVEREDLPLGSEFESR